MTSGPTQHRCKPLECGQQGGSVEPGLLERKGERGAALKSSPWLWRGPIRPEIQTEPWSANHNSQKQWQKTLASYPDSVVPRLSFSCQWLDSKSVTNCSTAQTVAALDFVCNDPHLHWNKREQPSQEEKIMFYWCTLKKKRNKQTKPPKLFVLTWSRGPTETLRTLLEMCSQEEPWG